MPSPTPGRRRPRIPSIFHNLNQQTPTANPNRAIPKGSAYNPRPRPTSTRLCRCDSRAGAGDLFGRTPEGSRADGKHGDPRPGCPERPLRQKFHRAPFRSARTARSASQHPLQPPAAQTGVGAVIEGDRVLRLGEKQPALDDETERGAGHREPGRRRHPAPRTGRAPPGCRAPAARTRRAARSGAAGAHACGRCGTPSPSAGNFPRCAAARTGAPGRGGRARSRSRPCCAPRWCR